MKTAQLPTVRCRGRLHPCKGVSNFTPNGFRTIGANVNSIAMKIFTRQTPPSVSGNLTVRKGSFVKLFSDRFEEGLC